jgi:hypothetical protein
MSQSPTMLLRDDILIRRIPPNRESFVTIVMTHSGRYRAASSMLSVDADEDDLSCSLLRITTPLELLEYLEQQQIDSNGWHICAFRVRDVQDLGFQVCHTPAERDAGHCSISNPMGGPRFPESKAKKLAKKALVLNEDEIQDPTLISRSLP